ncbi:hypothetical protein ABW21_db0204453 [Orbilia brochopaga]|nr:hypothetical protein ABW21_db0204453 [Drechslerella brochopaga]
MQSAIPAVIQHCQYTTKPRAGQKAEILFTGMDALVCFIVKKETPELTVTMGPFQRNVHLTTPKVKVPTIPNTVTTTEALVTYVWDKKTLRDEILHAYNYVTVHESGKNTKDDTVVGLRADHNDAFIPKVKGTK